MKLETIVSCRTDIYFDYQLIDAMTGKILVDRVYDKTYKKSNKKRMGRILPIRAIQALDSQGMAYS